MVVAGDVDGALAAALAARKLAVPVAHLEARLRCGDADMPEEINRRAIDAIASLLWAPDEASAEGLLAEGHRPEAVRAVGNAMIDTLRRNLPAARDRPLPEGLSPRAYGVVTLHRAGNVDAPPALRLLLAALADAARLLPLVWPVHPRTLARLAARGSRLAARGSRRWGWTCRRASAPCRRCRASISCGCSMPRGWWRPIAAGCRRRRRRSTCPA